MRDALLNFGAIAPATKATRAVSANKINFGGVHKPGNVENAKACFRLGDDIASGDTVQMEVLGCSTENGTYGVCSCSAVISSGKEGDIIEVPLPIDAPAYLEAGVMPNSSGTFTPIDVTAWIEFR